MNNQPVFQALEVKLVHTAICTCQGFLVVIFCADAALSVGLGFLDGHGYFLSFLAEVRSLVRWWLTVEVSFEEEIQVIMIDVNIVRSFALFFIS